MKYTALGVELPTQLNHRRNIINKVAREGTPRRTNMARHDVRPCPCGSGEPSSWQFDADGIELCRTCCRCHQKKMAGYRRDIQTRSSRFYGEQVDSDY